MSFAADTRVEVARADLYHTEIALGWDIGGNTNGGYLLALVARAAIAAGPHPHPLTVTGHYLAPARAGEAEIAVTALRVGGRHSTASALLRSAGKPLLAALVTSTDLGRLDGVERIDAVPPELPPPDACPAHVDDGSFPRPFLSRVEMRIHPHDYGHAHGRPTGEARMRGWFRLCEDEPLDPFAVLVAADAFPPPIFNAAVTIGWVPTVELTVHLRSLPSDGWLACETRTRFVTGGYLEADGEIWDADGRLVAMSRQLMLVPRSPAQ